MNLLYKCSLCNYETSRLLNFKRHGQRKIPCYNKYIVNTNNLKAAENVTVAAEKVDVAAEKVDVAAEKVDVAAEKVDVAAEKVDVAAEKVDVAAENVTDTAENVTDTEKKIVVGFDTNFKCNKCNKTFTRLYTKSQHVLKCDGIDKRQCQICLKLFATKYGKYQHIKYVKCTPPSSSHNTTVNNNITNNTNINSNNTTNNINIRVDFGNECLKKLCEDKEYFTKMIENIKLGKYAIPKSIEDIYFNDKYPENQTLKKTSKNDNMVSIQYNGKWETRLFEDIINDLVKKTEEYHETYFKDLQKKYENLNNNKHSKKFMIHVRRFANKMLWFGWNCRELRNIGLHFYERKDMDEEDLNEMFEFQKQINKLILLTIYDNSRHLLI